MTLLGPVLERIWTTEYADYAEDSDLFRAFSVIRGLNHSFTWHSRLIDIASGFIYRMRHYIRAAI